MNSNSPYRHEEQDDDGEDVFLDESDIIQEIPVDEEELPDADDEDGDGDDGIEGAVDEEDDSVHIFTGHSGELYAACCSPTATDATLVATGGGDDRGFMWRIGQGDFAFELLGHKDSVSSLAFSSDGDLLASGSLDGLIKVWDVDSRNLKCTLEGPDKGIEWLKWHPIGKLILAGSEDGIVWMWNAEKGASLNMFTGHAESVTCGDFTPDGKTICTGSDDATLRIWNPRSSESIHVVRGHPYHTEGLTCLAISKDSTLVLTGSKDGSAHIVNIKTGKVVSSLNGHSDSIECIGLSASSPWAATGSMDQKLIIWDLQHSLPRCTCEHEEGVTCLLWLGTSRYVATGCADGKVRVWDSLSGDCVRTFSGHSDAIQSLAASSDGNFLVSASIDGTARVFETPEFKYRERSQRELEEEEEEALRDTRFSEAYLKEWLQDPWFNSKIEEEKELKRLQHEAEKEEKRREREESELRKQLKKQQEEAEKDQRRKEKEESELKKQHALQKQASLMERFLKKNKSSSPSQNDLSLNSTMPDLSSDKRDKMLESVTTSMDSILSHNDGINAEDLWRSHLNSLHGLGHLIRSNGKVHWGIRRGPRTEVVKELKLTTNKGLTNDDELSVVKLVDTWVDSNTDSTSCHVNRKSSPSGQKKLPKITLLQFDQSYRPAFYGVWPKKSEVVRPRCPSMKDPELDYEIDSDEEWEEEEPRESLSDCDKDEVESLDEECTRGDDEESEDGFFVPDGYLSEDENSAEADKLLKIQLELDETKFFLLTVNLSVLCDARKA
nr:angio-associated migratory cell protein [Ipomoea batatas]